MRRASDRAIVPGGAPGRAPSGTLGGRVALAFAAALALAGCTVTAADCDPSQVGSVWTAGACQVSGVSDRRVQTLQAEVDRKVGAYRLARAETRQLQSEAQSLAADRALWESRVGDMEQDLDRLELRLSGLRASNAEDEVRLRALQNELAETRQQLNAASVAERATQAEIEQLTIEVERRRQAIEAYLSEIDVVE